MSGSNGALLTAVPGSWSGGAKLAARLALVAAPFLLWTAYVKSVFPAFSYSNPDSFSLPF